MYTYRSSLEREDWVRFIYMPQFQRPISATTQEEWTVIWWPHHFVHSTLGKLTKNNGYYSRVTYQRYIFYIRPNLNPRENFIQFLNLFFIYLDKSTQDSHFSSNNNCYQWRSYLPCETPTKEHMKLAMRAIFTTEGLTGE